MLRRSVYIALLALYSIFVVPVVLVGIGMSGGRILSPTGFLYDIAELDPAIFLRFVAWTVVIYLVAGATYPFLLVIKRVRARGQ